MSKYYRRSKFKNNYILAANYDWSNKPIIAFNTVGYSEHFSNKIGSGGNFIKALIVRGIGYRVFALSNDFVNLVGTNPYFTKKMRPIHSLDTKTDALVVINNTAALDFPYGRYVLVRAGHTRDLILPLDTTV